MVDDLIQRHKPARRAPGRPKRSDFGSAADTEKAIIEQAKALFMKSGFSAVSISTIVEAVGITKPTLYYYFEDKEHLYASILCSTLKNGSRFLIHGIEEKNTLYDQMLYLISGFLNNSPTSISLLLRDAKEHVGEANLQIVYDTYDEYILTPLGAMFQAAIDRGEIHNIEPKLLAQIMLGAMDNMVTALSARYSQTYNRDELAKILVDSLIHGIKTR